MQLNQDKIKKITIESKYLNVLGVVLFLIVVFVGYLVSDGILRQVNIKKSQVDTKKSELKARLDNVEKFKDLKKNVSDFPEKVEILDNIKNEQQSVEQLISQIEKIAVVSGVKLSSISPDMTNQAALQATLAVSGDYAAVKKFLNGVENNQLILNVSDITISGEEPSLSVGLTVKAGF